MTTSYHVISDFWEFHIISRTVIHLYKYYTQDAKYYFLFDNTSHVNLTYKISLISLTNPSNRSIGLHFQFHFGKFVKNKFWVFFKHWVE